MNLFKKPNKHGCLRKIDKDVDSRDWIFSEHPKCKASKSQKLPKKVSLKKGFGRIYNQPYGNCTSAAVLACDAYYYHDPNKNWLPSMTFTYYVQRVDICHSDPKVDAGSSVYVALKAVINYGACNSKVWQNRKPFYKKPSLEAYEDGLKGKELIEYYNVSSVADIKKALSLGYPVVVASAWPDDDRTNKENCIRVPSDKEIEESEGGHAYVIIGYDDTKQWFEIRNSWGKSFGNGGYAFMKYKHFEKVAFWNDCYAVVK